MRNQILRMIISFKNSLKGDSNGSFEAMLANIVWSDKKKFWLLKFYIFIDYILNNKISEKLNCSKY